MVHLFFLLISPPDRPGDHLRALENISRQLRDDTFCRFLKQAKSAEEIEQLLDEADNNQFVSLNRSPARSTRHHVTANRTVVVDRPGGLHARAACGDRQTCAAVRRRRSTIVPRASSASTRPTVADHRAGRRAGEELLVGGHRPDAQRGRWTHWNAVRRDNCRAKHLEP